jgi:hypothetical protein
MPVLTTYPGVYIEEIPSGVHTITGVATSITAFIGRAVRGLTNEPPHDQQLRRFRPRVRGLDADYPMSYAVRDFISMAAAKRSSCVWKKTPPKPFEMTSSWKPPALVPGANTLVYVVDGKGITDDVAERFGVDKTDLL